MWGFNEIVKQSTNLEEPTRGRLIRDDAVTADVTAASIDGGLRSKVMIYERSSIRHPQTPQILLAPRAQLGARVAVDRALGETLEGIIR